MAITNLSNWLSTNNSWCSHAQIYYSAHYDYNRYDYVYNRAINLSQVKKLGNSANAILARNESGQTALHYLFAAIMPPKINRVITKFPAIIVLKENESVSRVHGLVGAKDSKQFTKIFFKEALAHCMSQLTDEQKKSALLSVDNSGRSLLHYYSVNAMSLFKEDNIECFEPFLSAMTLLSAAEKQRLAVMQDNKGNTFLHSMVTTFNVASVIDFLLSDVRLCMTKEALQQAFTIRNQRGHTPLNTLLSSKSTFGALDVSTLAGLYDQGFPELILQRSRRKWTSLHYAARRGDAEIFIALFDKLPEEQRQAVILQDLEVSSLIPLICRHGDIQMLERVLACLSPEQVYQQMRHSNAKRLQSWVARNSKIVLPDYQRVVEQRSYFMDVYHYLYNRQNEAFDDDYRDRLQDFVTLLRNIAAGKLDILEGTGTFLKTSYGLFSGTQRYQDARNCFYKAYIGQTQEQRHGSIEEIKQFLNTFSKNSSVASAMLNALNAPPSYTDASVESKALA